MITLYRPAYQSNPRSSSTYGHSGDEKPMDKENGAWFIEIDTGIKYRFDKENQTWCPQN